MSFPHIYFIYQLGMTIVSRYVDNIECARPEVSAIDKCCIHLPSRIDFLSFTIITLRKNFLKNYNNFGKNYNTVL